MSELAPRQPLPDDQKSDFWRHFAGGHISEMRLLLRGGKLWKNDGWRNVVEHGLVQAGAADVLSEALQLSDEDRKKLITTALCHDWQKRLTAKPQDFSDTDRREAMVVSQKINPDPILMAATEPDFVERALIQKQSSLLERIQFYLDDICMGSEIVDLDKRIDEAERRRPDLNDNQDLCEKLGGKYWDKERELGHNIENEFFDLLLERKVTIESPSKIVGLIKSRLEERYSKLN